MANFVVVRIANKADGTVAIPVQSFEDETAAWKEYYRQVAIAVDSNNVTDSLALLTKQGFQLDYKTFTHDPQPEPNEG